VNKRNRKHGFAQLIRPIRLSAAPKGSRLRDVAAANRLSSRSQQWRLRGAEDFQCQNSKKIQQNSLGLEFTQKTLGY
jgi:hypothetical protein